MRKKTKSQTPGTALIKHAHRERMAVKRSMRNLDEGERRFQEKSVTELGNLEDFLAEAELAETNFEADRDAKLYQVTNTGLLVDLQEDSEEEEEGDEKDGDFELTMPRRPDWVLGETTAEELNKMEKTTFLEWRRHLAKLEERATKRGLLPTPFEKNLQFWRQLWRVMERSDVLVQVVDARNPMLFRFEDLEVYAKEMNKHKRCMLLINKADLLTKELRVAWSEYLTMENIDFVFFSAKETQVTLESHQEERPLVQGKMDVLNRTNLLQYLEMEANAAARDANQQDENATGIVGMVGYPNVGKSSVINALLGVTQQDHQAQRVSVSATPGHTKHFQTMNIGPVTLCDCPGLVFPSFLSSKAEMLCNGILPIDEIRGREFVPALELLAERIPRRVLERTYKFKLDLPATFKYSSYTVLLEGFCKFRGLYAQGPGRFDESRGSRLLLKDFVCGKLLYCHPPPGYRLKEAEDDGPAELISEDEEEEEEDYDEDDDDEDGDGQSHRHHDYGVTEAADLLNHIHLPIQTEDQVLYEAGKTLHVETSVVDQSRRLLKHGRKHKKARDRTPYDHDASMFVAKLSGKKEGTKFVRKAGHS